MSYSVIDGLVYASAGPWLLLIAKIEAAYLLPIGIETSDLG